MLRDFNLLNPVLDKYEIHLSVLIQLKNFNNGFLDFEPGFQKIKLRNSSASLVLLRLVSII